MECPCHEDASHEDSAQRETLRDRLSRLSFTEGRASKTIPLANRGWRSRSPTARPSTTWRKHSRNCWLSAIL